MPPFVPLSREIASFITRGIGARRLLRPAMRCERLRRPDRMRCLSQIPGMHASVDCSFGTLCNKLRKRQFFSCSNGEEGGVLSRIYEETRVMGYSPERLFDVVAAVDLYHGFVPWCQKSEILKHNPDGSFEAELEIGFKFLCGELRFPCGIEKATICQGSSANKYLNLLLTTTALDSNLFDHLINTWEFNPGPVKGTCDLHFLVDFKFLSPLYGQVASMFFEEVVSRMVKSFSGRCQIIYGPGVNVEKHTIQ